MESVKDVDGEKRYETAHLVSDIDYGNTGVISISSSKVLVGAVDERSMASSSAHGGPPLNLDMPIL